MSRPRAVEWLPKTWLSRRPWGSPWERPRDARHGALQTFALMVAFASPSIGLIAPQAFQIAFIAAAVAAAVAVALAPGIAGRIIAAASTPLGVIIGALCLYIGLQSVRYDPSAPISDHMIRPLLIFCLISGLACIALYRKEFADLSVDRLFSFACLATVVLLCLLTLYQQAAASLLPLDQVGSVTKGIREINRYLSTLAIFVFLIPAAQGGRVGLFLITVGILYVATFTIVGHVPQIARVLNVPSDTVQIGVPLALLVYVLTIWMPRAMTGVVFTGIGVVVALAPWIYTQLYTLAPIIVPVRRHLVMDRVEIWYGAARRVLDDGLFHFVYGHGREFLRVDGDFQVPGDYTHQIPFHPHNIVLQLWVDMGAIGAMFGLVFLWQLYRLVCRSSLAQRPAMLSSVAMLMLVGLVTHSLWQTWFLSAIFLVVLLMTLLINAAERSGTVPPNGMPAT